MLFFRVESRDEEPGKTGLSHLLEHMMFNGSKKFPPGEFDRILESAGGFSNAYTSEDITAYYETFPPEALPKVLEMERDRFISPMPAESPGRESLPTSLFQVFLLPSRTSRPSWRVTILGYPI